MEFSLPCGWPAANQTKERQKLSVQISAERAAVRCPLRVTLAGIGGWDLGNILEVRRQRSVAELVVGLPGGAKAMVQFPAGAVDFSVPILALELAWAQIGAK